jgi:hypothetical protein
LVTPGPDQNTVTVAYQFLPPGGGWDVSDNGTYTVSIAPGGVVDAANNGAVLAAPIAFAVDVPAPSPVDPTFGTGGRAIIGEPMVSPARTPATNSPSVPVGRSGSCIPLHVIAKRSGTSPRTWTCSRSTDEST